jgi:hypothetical protein
MERVVNGTAFDVFVDGPVIPLQMQINSGTVAANNTVAWPSTIAATGSFVTGTNPIAINGFPHYAIGGVLTQTGTVIVQPYLDKYGNVPVGTASTAAITANSAFTLDGSVGTSLVIQTIGITIRNGNAGAAATLTNPVLVLQSS